MGQLGLIMQDSWRLADAREFHEASCVASREVGARHDELASLVNLATTEFLLGRLLDARDHYGDALRAAREIGDARLEGYALTGLGDVARDLQVGQPGQAICPLGASCAGRPPQTFAAVQPGIDILDIVQQVRCAKQGLQTAPIPAHPCPYKRLVQVNTPQLSLKHVVQSPPSQQPIRRYRSRFPEQEQRHRICVRVGSK